MEGKYICSNCGKENPPGSQFCIFCGNQVTQQTPNQNLCPHCGKVLKEGAKFCNFCGNQSIQSTLLPYQQQPIQNDPLHDHTFGSNVQPNYDQRPIKSPDMSGYYQEQKMRRTKTRPERVKKPERVKRQRAPKQSGSGFNVFLVPIILFIIAAISAFIITWQITVVILVIAIVSLYYVRKKNAEINNYEWMGL